MAFMLSRIFRDRAEAPGANDTRETITLEIPLGAAAPLSNPATPLLQAQDPPDPAQIIAPYDAYVLTQGPHGQSYGHMALDIAAGKGTAIKSPISGEVTARYIDELGNPTLVIENEIYRVTLLHGDYTVRLGETVAIGQPIGTESNKGNTVDRFGIPCQGRPCGYHTHLNVFDKRLGQSVNPLPLITP